MEGYIDVGYLRYFCISLICGYGKIWIILVGTYLDGNSQYQLNNL